MRKISLLLLICSGLLGAADPLFATGDADGDGYTTAGIESLTTTAGAASNVATEDNENSNLVVELPADVSEDGTISGGLGVSCSATPNEADNFQGKEGREVIWKVMKGHEKIGGQTGGESFSYAIQRLGRYRISATSGNTIAQYLIVGPMVMPDEDANTQLGPVAVSNSSNNGERFIVVPPKTTAFPQDKIVVKALGSASDQFKALFEWGCEPADRGTANEKENRYEIKRPDFQDPQSLEPVKLKVQLKSDGTELDKVTILPGYVEEVTFSGTTNFHQIRPDDGGPVYQAPHLKDTDGDGDGADEGEENKPVAYTRETKPIIGGKLKIGSASSLQNVKIRVNGPDGVKIDETSATVSGDYLTLPPTVCSTALPPTIKYYDKKENPFELEWQMQIDGGDWVTVATTKHTVYVTLEKPATEVKQETLFKVACKSAAGIDDEDMAMAMIWLEFEKLKISRMDSRVLTYWASHLTESDTTEKLIKNGDGLCMAWCKFFIDVLRIHGITGQKIKTIYVLLPEFMMISDWEFLGSGKTREGTFDYLNIINATGLMTTPQYSFSYVEILDKPGIAGQGEGNPASIFSTHHVVAIEEGYCDPSYGKLYGSVDDFSLNVLGYCLPERELYLDEPEIGLDLNGNGNKTDLGVKTQPCLIARKKIGLVVGVDFGDDVDY